MNVSLTPELEQLIDEKVKSGLYHSASEVVREGLRLLQEQDELRKIKFEALKREIAKGIESVEKGRVKEFDAERIKTEGRRRLAARK